MSTNQGQPTLQELMSRVAALEQAATEQKLSGGTAPATISTQGNFASSVPGMPAVNASGPTTRESRG